MFVILSPYWVARPLTEGSAAARRGGTGVWRKAQLQVAARPVQGEVTDSSRMAVLSRAGSKEGQVPSDTAAGC